LPNNKKNAKGKQNVGNLTPQQLAVIAALLTNALHVESVLINKDKTVQIVLQGSLKRKTRMDRILEEMNDMTIGDFIKSIMKQ
jgi:hypothetical protein